MVDKIAITFIQNNEKITVDAMEGQSILDLAHENGLDLDGQCEGSLACSTCHVVVEDKLVYEALPKASEDEEDMLDMANGLTATSRLGCQLIVNKSLNGAVFRIPNK